MFKKLLTLIAIISIFPILALAEDPYAIMDKSIEITKAKIKKDSINSFKFVVNITSTNPMTQLSEKVILKYWYKKDEKYRVDQLHNDVTTKFGTNGDIVWVSDQTGNKYEKAPDNQKELILQSIKAQNIIDSGIMEYNKDSIKLEYIAQETIDGKDCHKIKATYLNEPTPLYVFIDAITGLLYQFQQETPQGIYQRKIIQYTKVNGFFFPLKIEEWFKGEKFSDKIYQNISVNPKIDDRLFDMPSN